jgi:uncharacterized membrane-anchored protein YitT (DUF2179 family)
MATMVLTLRNAALRMAIPWLSILTNLGLISAGCLVFTFALKGVLIPNQLLSGGPLGIAMLAHYLFPWIDIGWAYFAVNIPLVLLGWYQVSRRFMAYTLYGMAFFSLAAGLVQLPASRLDDPILAALFAGVIGGIGGGLILRSLGSAGGLDILVVYFNKRFGLRPGMVYTAANVLVLGAGAWFMDLEKILYSVIFVFVFGQVVDVILTGFNRRKSMLIVSDRADEMAREILHRKNRGVTFLYGEGAYTGTEKRVIFTVLTLVELPKMKNLIYGIDPNAFVVVNDTLEVMGARHGARRVY